MLGSGLLDIMTKFRATELKLLVLADDKVRNVLRLRCLHRLLDPVFACHRAATCAVYDAVEQLLRESRAAARVVGHVRVCSSCSGSMGALDHVSSCMPSSRAALIRSSCLPLT